MLQAAIVPVTPFQQNCTLVWDDETKEGVVVDPGGDADRLQEAIQQAGIKVQRILLTHGHLDHAGGAAELAEALGVPIEGPQRADAFLLDSLPEQGAKYGMACRAVTPDRWLEEGESVDIAGQDFAVLHCPAISTVSPSSSQRSGVTGRQAIPYFAPCAGRVSSRKASARCGPSIGTPSASASSAAAPAWSRCPCVNRMRRTVMPV